MTLIRPMSSLQSLGLFPIGLHVLGINHRTVSSILVHQCKCCFIGDCAIDQLTHILYLFILTGTKSVQAGLIVTLHMLFSTGAGHIPCETTPYHGHACFVIVVMLFTVECHSLRFSKRAIVIWFESDYFKLKC